MSIEMILSKEECLLHTHVKERILKAVKEQWLITETESLIRLIADFLLETTEVIRQLVWHIQSDGKKEKLANKELYNKKNYSWKVKEKIRHAQESRNEENSSLAVCSTRNIKGIPSV